MLPFFQTQRVGVNADAGLSAQTCRAGQPPEVKARLEAHPRPVRVHRDIGSAVRVDPAAHEPLPVGWGSAATSTDCPPALQAALEATVQAGGPPAPH